MAIISVEDLQRHVTTALGDEALQDIIDYNQAAIDAIYPVGVSQSKTYFFDRPESIILLPRAPLLTVSPLTPVVVEFWNLTDQRTLADDDYFIEGSTLRRLDGGTNPDIYFQSPVRVTWSYADDARLEGIMLRLCKLDAVNGVPGRTAFTVGKHREEFASGDEADYVAQREAILAELLPPGPLFG